MMGVLGKLIHLSVDAVLVSTVIAGLRRSSGFACVATPAGHTAHTACAATDFFLC